MDLLCIPNDQPLLSLTHKPLDLMQASLAHVLETHPPETPPQEAEKQAGLLSGHTSVAYLFFQLSVLHPNVQVKGHDLLHWAKQYLQHVGTKPTFQDGVGGIVSNKLAYEALAACINKEDSDLQAFLSNVPALVGPYPEGEKDPFESELLYGRAGALYLMRLIRAHVPGSAASLAEPIAQISQKILDARKPGDDGSWVWIGQEYFGAGHGDIGIITQLVLTTPSLAPTLKRKLETLLDLQSDGHWPTNRKSLSEGATPRVQWCHGAPGYTNSLLALRPYFADDLKERIDVAVSKAEEVTWKYGLLKKEPNICHGILGNALALPRGPRRDHFLALATTEEIEKARAKDPEVFKEASYGMDMAITFNYHPSAAWTWGVCEQEYPPIIAYTDV